MFVGRKTELESLNNSYQKDRFQFPVIYGRRRAGKTTLISLSKKSESGGKITRKSGAKHGERHHLKMA